MTFDLSGFLRFQKHPDWETPVKIPEGCLDIYPCRAWIGFFDGMARAAQVSRYCLSSGQL
jgi:hypothetical protein